MRKQISPAIQYFIAAVALASASFGLWSGLAVRLNLKMAGLPTASVVNPSPFAKIAVEAKAAFVYEPDTGRVLYAKDEHKRLPIASITKVMTALTAARLLPDSAIAIRSLRR